MKDKMISEYFKSLFNDYKIIDRLKDVSEYVLRIMSDPDYGQRFVKKSMFLKDFNDWLKSEVAPDAIVDFKLDNSIPDDSTMDVKIIKIPSSYITTGDDMNIKYEVVTIQLHNARPKKLFTTGEYSPVTALCKTSKPMELIPINDECDCMYQNMVVGVILVSDKRFCEDRFPHIVRHELAHYLMHVYAKMMDSSIFKGTEKDEFHQGELEEFLADILPYTVTGNSVIHRFKKDLFLRFNPQFSTLYDKILRVFVKYIMKYGGDIIAYFKSEDDA